MMKYLYLLVFVVISSQFCFAGTPPVPPPPYDSLSLKTKGVKLGNINPGSAPNGATLQILNGNLVLGSTSAMDSLSLISKRSIMWLVSPDNATTSISAPSLGKMTLPTISACTDSEVYHPNIIYFPNKFHGYSLVGVFSVSSRGTCKEKSFLRVSNDNGATWTLPSGCPDPLTDITYYKDSANGNASATYLSDPCVFLGKNGDSIYVIQRPVWSTGGKERLYIKSTVDFQNWSTERAIVAMSANSNLVSPAVKYDSISNKYRMWTVYLRSAFTPGNRVLVRENSGSPYNGTWSFVDTLRDAMTGKPFPCGQDTSTAADDSIGTSMYVPWHIGLAPIGNGDDFFFLTCVNLSTINTTNEQHRNYIGITSDGLTTTMRSLPLSKATFKANSPDSEYVYKATGWVRDSAGYKLLECMQEGVKSNWANVNRYQVRILAPAYPNRQPLKSYRATEIWCRETNGNDSTLITLPKGTDTTGYIAKDSSYKAAAIIDSFSIGGLTEEAVQGDSIIFWYYNGVNTVAIDSVITYMPKWGLVQADSLQASNDVNWVATTQWTRVAVPYNVYLAANQMWKAKLRVSLPASGDRKFVLQLAVLKARPLQ